MQLYNTVALWMLTHNKHNNSCYKMKRLIFKKWLNLFMIGLQGQFHYCNMPYWHMTSQKILNAAMTWKILNLDLRVKDHIILMDDVTPMDVRCTPVKTCVQVVTPHSLTKLGSRRFCLLVLRLHLVILDILVTITLPEE